MKIEVNGHFTLQVTLNMLVCLTTIIIYYETILNWIPGKIFRCGFVCFLSLLWVFWFVRCCFVFVFVFVFLLLLLFVFLFFLGGVFWGDVLGFYCSKIIFTTIKKISMFDDILVLKCSVWCG